MFMLYIAVASLAAGTSASIVGSTAEVIANTPAMEGRIDSLGVKQLAADGQAAAETGQWERAATLMEEAANALKNDASWRAKDYRKGARQYRMVGKPAPATPVKRWINRGADTLSSPVVFDGRVTVMEITIQGCVACTIGYPILRRLDAKFRERGVQTMLLAPSQDDGRASSFERTIATLKTEWGEKGKIEFPIGVVQQTRSDEADGAAYAPCVLEKEYFVRGYPTYLVIDQNGVVRYLSLGAPENFEQTVNALVEQLLQAPKADVAKPADSGPDASEKS
jgi:hypothetical protein